MGELGWELHHSMTDMAKLYDLLSEAGEEFKIIDFGAHAMNSLRMEKGYRGWGLGLKTVDKCVKEAEKRKVEMIEVLNSPENMGIRGKQADALNTFYNIISKYNELLPKLNAGELVRALIEEAGIKRYYHESSSPEESERFENVLEFIKSVDDFMKRNPDGGLYQFIEEVSLLTDLDQWNDQTNRVTMMTVHASKGLEFPVVFLTGLEDGLFPMYSALDSNDTLEEERRLFYVGVTRAMNKVYLMYANNRRRMAAAEVEEPWPCLSSERMPTPSPMPFVRRASASSSA